jgi:hypothetical protein
VSHTYVVSKSAGVSGGFPFGRLSSTGNGTTAFLMRYD